MDRRRFIPPSLGLELEARTLLSTTAAGLVGIGTTTSTASNLPDTLAQRNKRIDHLPFILESFVPGRALPTEVTAPIQNDLRALIGTLRSPSHAVLEGFNRTIRSAKPDLSLTALNAESLIKAFNAVLRDAGTNDTLRTKFVGDMANLARLESTGPEPTIAAINDFGTLAQLSVAVGQPFAAPSAPGLSGAEKIAKHAATYQHQPTFIGGGAAGTVLQVIDGGTQQVIASGVVPTNGTYSLKAFVPLADGTHVVYAQTVDGPYISLLSTKYTFKVYTQPTVAPHGPRH